MWDHVAASFSTEWADYDYGDILWTAPTDDRIRTFRGECGLTRGDLNGKRFSEIGCGLGITTNEAGTILGAEAWGMDLSGAVSRAAAQFRTNPNVHFVQASIFAPPFGPGTFDFVYSHGVLHHTWSTKAALSHAAELVRSGGSLYVWVYGYDDVRISILRRIAFAAETIVRPVLARLPPKLAMLALSPLIPMYRLASLVGRWSGTPRDGILSRGSHALSSRPFYASLRPPARSEGGGWAARRKVLHEHPHDEGQRGGVFLESGHRAQRRDSQHTRCVGDTRQRQSVIHASGLVRGGGVPDHVSSDSHRGRVAPSDVDNHGVEFEDVRELSRSGGIAA